MNIKDLKNYMVTDYCNVMAVIPLHRDKIEDKINLSYLMNVKTYKRIESPKIKMVLLNLHPALEGEVIEIENSRYPLDYIKNITKMGNIFWGRHEIYMAWDEKQEEIIKDRPILFVFGKNFGVVLSPRVKSE